MAGTGSCSCKNIRIVEGIFGEIPSGSAEASDDAASIKVKSFKMSNNYGMEVIVIAWGATIVSIKCPDKYGDSADIVLGFDNLEGYLDPRLNQMLGCIVGRSSADVKLEESGGDGDKGAETAATDGKASGNCFGRRLWEACVEDDCRVVMSYLSPDGEDGYPGALLATVKFELTRCNELEIGMRGVSSKPTRVDLSHGSVFNLAGHASGPDELRAHEISLNCDRWIRRAGPESANAPDAIRPVGGSPMDLRLPRPLGQLIQQRSSAPHCCLAITRGPGSLRPQVSFVSRVFHPKTGRFLEVYSDQPAVELCTGDQLPAAESRSDLQPSPSASFECHDVAGCDCDSQSSSVAGLADPRIEPSLEFLPGKCGAKYRRFGGFSLLPQNPSATAKIPLLPSATLRPGQVYYHDLVYKFGIDLDNCVP